MYTVVGGRDTRHQAPYSSSKVLYANRGAIACTVADGTERSLRHTPRDLDALRHAASWLSIISALAGYS
jgi:hypothetical protein